MTCTRRTVLAAALALASSPASILAHPVYDLYDLTTVLEMTGTVLRFEYATPHSWLYISLIDEAGNENRWAFEMDPSPLLRRRGVDEAFWQAGDRISVRANPMKDGRMAGLLLGAVAASGNAFGETEGLAKPEAG